MVITIRWVDGQLNAHEEFIGLYSLPSTEAETIVSVLKDVLLRLNLSMKKIRGQCYDGASSMCGIKTGVAKQIRDIEPRAFYTHCYGHSLNLAASLRIAKLVVMIKVIDVCLCQATGTWLFISSQICMYMYAV